MKKMNKKLANCIKKIGKIVGRLLTYALVMLCTAAVIIGVREERTTILGYSFFTVLSYSMDPVYPKDSLIAIKETDPDGIEVGDDITFLENATKLVTHRVVEIYEDYEGSGMRGFQTKGINNPYIDEEIVYGGNIIGVVVYSAPWIGSLSSYVRENLLFCCGLAAVLFIFLYIVKRLFSKNEESVPQDKVAE